MKTSNTQDSSFFVSVIAKAVGAVSDTRVAASIRDFGEAHVDSDRAGWLSAKSVLLLFLGVLIAGTLPALETVQPATDPDLGGRVEVVTFFTTTCVPCADRLARWDDLVRVAASEGLAMRSRAVSGELRPTIEDFLEVSPILGEVVSDPGVELARAYGLTRLPVVVVVVLGGGVRVLDAEALTLSLLRELDADPARLDQIARRSPRSAPGVSRSAPPGFHSSAFPAEIPAAAPRAVPPRFVAAAASSGSRPGRRTMSSGCPTPTSPSWLRPADPFSSPMRETVGGLTLAMPAARHGVGWPGLFLASEDRR